MNATEQARVEKMQARIIDLRDRLKAAKVRKLTARAGAANGTGKSATGSRKRKPAANLKGTRARARTRSAGKGAATASA